MTYLVAVACVVGIAVGQVLFKTVAASLQRAGGRIAFGSAITLGLALSLYGLTTLAWIWVLRRIELGRVYPLMAFAFVLVPFGTYLFLGERFPPQYVLGVVLIMAGIVVAVRA